MRALRVFAVTALVAAGEGCTNASTTCSQGDYYLCEDMCNMYVHCSHGSPSMRPCGPGLVFNPGVDVCDFKSNVPPYWGTNPCPIDLPTTSPVMVPSRSPSVAVALRPPPGPPPPPPPFY
eukprot:Hpha_TRINITY_DN36353_c0_g1::TRINITY_DN36353_c0_g1_i1::g.86338::m.86338